MKLRTAPIKDPVISISVSGQDPKRIVLATYRKVDKLHTRAVYDGISDLLQLSSLTEKKARAQVKRQIKIIRNTAVLRRKRRLTGAYALAVSWQKVGKNLETSMQKL